MSDVSRQAFDLVQASGDPVKEACHVIGAMAAIIENNAGPAVAHKAMTTFTAVIAERHGLEYPPAPDHSLTDV